MLLIELVLFHILYVYLMFEIILDIPKREDDDEEIDNDDDNKTENISDEGIEDNGSDSGITPNDYLISSVSKTDLDLMSMLNRFQIKYFLDFFFK